MSGSALNTPSYRGAYEQVQATDRHSHQPTQGLPLLTLKILDADKQISQSVRLQAGGRRRKRLP